MLKLNVKFLLPVLLQFGFIKLSAQGINQFWGITKQGGPTAIGSIFSTDSAGGNLQNRYSFVTGDGQFPSSGLTVFNNKLYGLSGSGGTNGAGTLFEYDPATSTFTKKVDMVAANGSNPFGGLTVYNNKLYGVTYSGGVNGDGTIFEYDPSTNTYTDRFDLVYASGAFPQGTLALYNNKFYGLATLGGANAVGVLFQYDPATNVYTDKIDMLTSAGNFGYNLTVYNNKFYGVTPLGGANSLGVIFEYDPAANVYTKRIDLSNSIGARGYGILEACNNKLYGLANQGGTNSNGVLFEYDTTSFTYTDKVDLTSATGDQPFGSMKQYNNKLYGLTSIGGVNNKGTLFEYDPSTATYTKKQDFNGTNGSFPEKTQLIVFPAPVSKGVLSTCEVLPSATIDNSNYNKWVPVTDSLGDIAAEINAHGNVLGTVTVSLFTKTGACREDANHRLYLNRNITITPQFQPVSGNVDLRLYVRKSELDSLKDAVNSMMQPSGVASIYQVDVFKNNDACAATGSIAALPLTATTGTYGVDYYLQVSVSSFSSFYFANKLLTSILPLELKFFTGIQKTTANLLQWKAQFSSYTSFFVERSFDGIHFSEIGFAETNGADTARLFEYSDDQPGNINNYYRLRMKQQNETEKYSATILLQRKLLSPVTVFIQPNVIASPTAVILTNSDKDRDIDLIITDMQGRVMQKNHFALKAGSNNIRLGLHKFAAGMYGLSGVYEGGKTNVQMFIKN